MRPGEGEQGLQAAIVELFHALGVFKRALVFSVPNEGKRTKTTAGRLKAMGMLPGIADLVLVHDGLAFFLEVKMPRGRLSRRQKEFRDLTRECTNCYAEGMTARFSGKNSKTGLPMYGAGFAEMTKAGPRWTGKVALIESKLREPFGWRKPRVIFVNSMSDLFHERLDPQDIARVYEVMEACGQHTFQVLTKRPERRLKIFDDWQAGEAERRGAAARTLVLPNVWEGTSVAIRSAVGRIDDLRRTPAAVRFLSCEPLLEDLGELELTGIDWLIIGGESGPKARPMERAWARNLMDQCRRLGVACFMKQTGCHLARQLGLSSRAGSVASEWPVAWPQEYPAARELRSAEASLHPESLCYRLLAKGLGQTSLF